MMRTQERPVAMAVIRGDEDHPVLRGVVEFFPEEEGCWVTVRVWGLPREGFFAFHIHEGSRCTGVGFSDTGGHWNPTNQPHPEHMGDLPPLLAKGGRARMGVWTGRFRAKDAIGRTVVIHSDPDDFHTQPSGNSGKKIACGVIVAACRGR